MLDNKPFFPALTGYRAIAAWLIFLYHFFPFKKENIPPFIKNIAGELHLGVDLFFVLSGFLITYRYFGKNKINFKEYMVNRIARIYPMYFLITFLVFLSFFIKNLDWSLEKTKELLVSITMTKALFSKYYFAGIPQGWTLTLEELFYISAPTFFILIKKNKNYIFILPIVIILVGNALKTLFNGQLFGFMQINISVYIFQFFVGIALALILKKAQLKQIHFSGFTYLGIINLMLYLVFRHYAAGFLKNDFARAAELLCIALLGIAPLLYGLMTEKTIIQKILSSKAMVLLGKSSYIFYLIHKGFIPILFNDYLSENKVLLFIFLNVVSLIMFHFIEEPINHYIRNKYTLKRD